MTLKPLYIMLIAVLFLSCSKNPETYIPHLNGYWEIDEVTMPNGDIKDYNFNSTIDYIELTDSMSGFRKKLKPNFRGSYETSANKEDFQIKLENDSLNIYYTTPYDQWKETVLEANETELLIINNRKIRYLYRHYEPLDLD